MALAACEVVLEAVRQELVDCFICYSFDVCCGSGTAVNISCHCVLQQDGCAVRHAFYQSFREDFDIMKEAGTCTHRAWHRIVRTPAPWTLHMA